MSEWLELELAEGLAPVRAPHDLWKRIERAQRQSARTEPARQLSFRLAFGSVALVVALGTVTAWGLVERHQPIDFQRLALAELQNSELASLQSSDAAEVSGWLARNGGFDVNLPQSDAAQISGARIVERDGMKMGEVLYRVKGVRASLMLAKPDRGMAVKVAQQHGHRTWQSRGIVYALACAAPESEHLECLLCHLGKS